MALAGRRQKGISGNVWPGFVDAMTALLLVLMFVLSIFMIVQFVLRETISGQKSELDELSTEVGDLASALGVELSKSADLTRELTARDASLKAAADRADQQTALIASLTRKSDAQAAQIADQSARITGFEAQVASLLSQRDDARLAGTKLAAERDDLMSQKQALDLALASARTEIDAQAEAARLAAARAEAVDALVADLRRKDTQSQASLADLAARLTQTEGARDAAQATVVSLRADVAAAEKERLAQLAALSALQDKVGTLDKERLTQLAAIDALQKRVGTLDSDKVAALLAASGLREKLDATEAARLALAAAQDDLTAKLKQADLDAQARAATLQALQGRLAEAASENATLSGDLDAVRQARLAEAAAIEALQQQLADAKGALSDEEKAKLAEAAAAEDLRRKLKDSDAELTSMTLALEAERKKAEETLTLLAAAKTASTDLSAQLAQRLVELSAKDAAVQERDDLRQRLQTAEAALAKAQAGVTDAQADRDRAASDRAGLEQRLAVAASVQEAMQSDLDDATARLARAQAELAALRQTQGSEEDLQKRLAAAIADKLAAQDLAATRLTDAERQSALLSQAQEALSARDDKVQEDARRMQALNLTMAALRQQITDLQSVVGEANARDADNRAKLDLKGSELNTALARAALAEKKLREAEAAEVVRLAAENKRLEKYRSDFFGRLRDVLSDRDGIRIVGDRFVFSSEVLFDVGSAALSPGGRAQIAKVKAILDEVSGEIPPGVDWIIRVDGHTDDVPITGGAFRDNWQLSQARALSVVEYMIHDLGFPPQRLAATGFGEWQPIDPADTPEARAKNRRIELKLTER